MAVIMIDRPERMNAFRARTVDELIACFKRAWADPEVGVVCLTGAGDRAFSTGGDQKQRAETGDYGPSESGLFEVETLHRLIREVPKPVIAAMNGYAIGGGHVLHVLCDLTLAADTSVFGQRSARVRVGFVFCSMTRRPPSAGASSTPSSPPPSCTPRSGAGPTRSSPSPP